MSISLRRKKRSTRRRQGQGEVRVGRMLMMKKMRMMRKRKMNSMWRLTERRRGEGGLGTTRMMMKKRREVMRKEKTKRQNIKICAMYSRSSTPSTSDMSRGLIMRKTNPAQS